MSINTRIQEQISAFIAQFVLERYDINELLVALEQLTALVKTEIEADNLPPSIRIDG